jgi:hemoglobin
LQKAIDEALAAAEREPSIQERAFIMRAAIDRVRDELGGKTTATAGKDKTTLWERLGGEKNVRKVVEDFMALEHADPKVDFFRGGKRKMTEEQLAELKQKLVEFISQAAGGPLKYAGKSMKEAHKGMAITEAQFDALVVDLKTALDKNGVKPADRDAVLEAVATMRRDIVEEKTGPKKDEEKKEPAKKEQEPKKGGGKPATAAAEIEGQITYDGKAVESGSIKLVPVKGEAAKPIESEIKNGGYHLTNVPPGEYTAVIASPPGKQKAKDAVPAQYGSEKTSPLRVSVNAGKNAFDIQLAK